MKKLYLLFLVMLAGVGSMWAEGSKSIVWFGGANAGSGHEFITDAREVNDKATGFSTQLEDGCTVTFTLTKGKMWTGGISGTWTNTDALDKMNAVLGSSFTAADFGQGSTLSFTASGAGGSKSTLSLTLPSSYTAGDAIVFYLSLSAKETLLSDFSVTGLDEAALSYASNNGSGFSFTPTYSSGSSAITIVKVVGKVTSSRQVVFASTTDKNAWQTVSYRPLTAEEYNAEAKPAALALLDAKLAKGRLLGTGVSHYTYTGNGDATGTIRDAELLLNNAEATITDINASITALDGIYANFRLNMPETGKLYRLRGYASKNYIAPAAATPDADTRMAMNADMDLPGTIFMFTNGDQVDSQAGYKLWNYSTGYYTKETHNLGAMADAANSMSIREATSGNPGCYMLHTNTSTSGLGTWIYDNTTVVDRNGSYSAGNCDWTMEEVTWLPIPVSNTYGIGTFYSPVDIAITDEGYAKDARLKFYIGSIDNDYLVLTKLENNLPAETPVVIEYVSDPSYQNGCAYLKIADSADAVEGQNDLRGTLETIAKPADDIYTLQPATQGAKELTFCLYTGETIKGCKAYLPAAKAVKGNRYNTGETTGIEGVATEKGNKEIFDLSGRRVQNPTSGLYIINGQKVYVK
ncbi:MAG: hypothetical protein KIG47_03385 [Prevotellamassilia sp.]|nr:hypothetical protein [Prevotellamassilia sp.]